MRKLRAFWALLLGGVSLGSFADRSYAETWPDPCAQISPPFLQSVEHGSSLIAHAGGEIEGHTYTNSLDALRLNYERGFRVFELDFRRTKDGAIVAVHDWAHWQKQGSFKSLPTEAQFLATPLWGHYEPINLERLESWLLGHPDTLLIADIKEDRLAILNELRAATSVPERWIPEVYTEAEIIRARQLGFLEPILMTDWNWPSQTTIKTLVENYKIRWVGFPWIRFEVSTLDSWLEAHGVRTLVHTVNGLSRRESLRRRGAEIFYTESPTLVAEPGYASVCDWIGERGSP